MSKPKNKNSSQPIGEIDDTEDSVVLPGWLNWRLCEQKDAHPSRTLEVALHSDAPVIGEMTDGSLGPYSLINTIDFRTRDTSFTAGVPSPVVLRVSEYPMTWTRPDWSRTDTANYHGGGMDEELASLISLAWGIRCRSGGITREFLAGQDPLGRPTAWSTFPPYLPPPRRRGSLLPRVRREVSLADGREILAMYPRCKPEDAQVLVKAARLYQEGIWGADADPQSAWLQLVSALEVPAVKWSIDSDDPLEQLSNVKPSWVQIISQLPKDDARTLAQDLNPLVRATARFLDFTLNHLPNPPSDRPPKAWQIAWSNTKMKGALSKIYDLRSRSLHDGTPFPVPMLEPPLPFENAGLFAEKPLGVGAFAAGGTWTSEDMPMTLATFEYIVRGALITWWRSIATEPVDTEKTGL